MCCGFPTARPSTLHLKMLRCVDEMPDPLLPPDSALVAEPSDQPNPTQVVAHPHHVERLKEVACHQTKHKNLGTVGIVNSTLRPLQSRRPT